MSIHHFNYVNFTIDPGTPLNLVLLTQGEVVVLHGDPGGLIVTGDVADVKESHVFLSAC